MSQNESIYIEKQGHLGWLIFNRPEQNNAFDQEMWRKFPKLIEALDADHEVKVIILKSIDGSSFSCGMDIEEIKAKRESADFNFSPMKPTTKAFDALSQCSKPTISMIQGQCIGGGCAIAFTTDLRTSSPDATFALTPAKIGLGYPMKGVERAVQELGASNARYLFVSGKEIDADHARRIGLVHEIHANENLEAATVDLANTVASNSPRSIRSILKMIPQVQLSPSDRNTRAIQQWINDCNNSSDYIEGINAFVEKRTPNFNDR